MKQSMERQELLAAGEATLALGTYAAGLRYADLPASASRGESKGMRARRAACSKRPTAAS